MTPQMIMTLLNEVEATFPVQDWAIDGLRVWPLIRFRLGYGLSGLFAPHSPRRLATLISQAIEGALRSVPVRLAGGNARLDRSVDALFLSDGVSFVRLGEVWYERFCDPLITAFAARGKTSGLLTPGSAYGRPRHTPSHFIQPRLDAIRLEALSARRLARLAPRYELPRYAAFEGWLAERTGGAVTVPAAAIAQQVDLIHRYAAYFEGVLARARPQLALMVSYYGNIQMGFTLACRRRGVPSVDLQHGVQGELHFAYGRWQAMPPEGYALMPSMFWTWGEEEAATIRRWPGGDHTPVVGGNLLLEHWDAIHPASANDKAALGAVRARHPGTVELLVTLSGVETPEELEELAKTLEQAPTDWFFWVRCHPGRLEQAAAVEAYLAGRGLKAFNVDLATRLPLYTLLRQVQVHLTAMSSSAIEAAQLGLPSVITHPMGVELFQGQIAAGGATAALTPGEIVAAIAEALGRGCRAPQVEAHRDGVDALWTAVAGRS